MKNPNIRIERKTDLEKLAHARHLSEDSRESAPEIENGRTWFARHGSHRFPSEIPKIRVFLYPLGIILKNQIAFIPYRVHFLTMFLVLYPKGCKLSL